MQYLDKIIEVPGYVDPLPKHAWYTWQNPSAAYGIDVYSSNSTKAGSLNISTGGEAQNNFGSVYHTNGQQTSNSSALAGPRQTQ